MSLGWGFQVKPVFLFNSFSGGKWLLIVVMTCTFNYWILFSLHFQRCLLVCQGMGWALVQVLVVALFWGKWIVWWKGSPGGTVGRRELWCSVFDLDESSMFSCKSQFTVLVFLDLISWLSRIEGSYIVFFVFNGSKEKNVKNNIVNNDSSRI